MHKEAIEMLINKFNFELHFQLYSHGRKIFDILEQILNIPIHLCLASFNTTHNSHFD